MKKVECIVQTHKVPELLERLDGSDSFFGVTESAVRGCGRQRGHLPKEETSRRVRLRPFARLEFVVPDDQAKNLVKIISEANKTGQQGVGDGKIFVSPVEDAVRISTGDRGEKGIV
ncbi:P-II family nitrogen regulator [Candidatus Zixiibacteriota bacterium]